ncbi:hypothetical protein BGZ46_007933, partial [Entomortierella lignicola]
MRPAQAAPPRPGFRPQQQQQQFPFNQQQQQQQPLNISRPGTPGQQSGPPGNPPM